MFNRSLCKKTNNNFKKQSDCQSTCVMRKKLMNLYKNKKTASVPVSCQHQKCAKPILLENYCTQDFIIQINDVRYNKENDVLRFNIIKLLASKESTMYAYIEQHQMSNGHYKVRVRDNCNCLKIKKVMLDKVSSVSYTLSGVIENSELVIDKSSYFQVFSKSDVKKMRGFTPITCNLFSSWNTYNINTNVNTAVEKAANSAGIKIVTKLKKFDSFVGEY